MAAKYSFTSIDSCEVEIDGYAFVVKGLSRKDISDYLAEVAALAAMEDDKERAKKAEELDRFLLEKAVADPKGRELIENASLKVYRKILEIIMELSGLKEETEKN